VRKSLNLPPRVTGVVIDAIAEDSPAADILAPGDIIIEINRKKIANVGEYKAIVASLKAGQNILLLIYRNGTGLFVTL
jgi:serine protease Do